MAVVLISYDLCKPGRNYNDLYDAIKKLSGFWAHPVESVWLVETNISTSEVRDALKKRMDSNDKLFVVQLALAWATYNVDVAVTNWLTTHLG